MAKPLKTKEELKKETAEAFYKEIPEYMIESTQKVFPPIFHKILDAMRLKTCYCK